MTNSTNFSSGTIVSRQWLNDVDRSIYEDVVNIMNYGADNTGAALINTALDLAKADCNTVFLPPGTYRVEGYNLQDLKLIGARSSGSNVGANEQTVIEGSGDIFTQANNFSLEHMVIRNSSAGTRGKLITIKDMDTKIGPITDVEFRKATHHIYAGNTSYAIVSGQLTNCRFSDASVYSRYYLHNLFAYDEEDCYTTSNQRGLYIRSCSTASIHGSATVFEYNEEGAIYVENTAVATDVIRSLSFDGIHFEANGQTTPTADVTINVSLSLGRIEFDSCGFYLPTVAATDVVNLSSSPTLRVFVHNCTDIAFANIAAGTIIAWATPKQSGQSNGFYVENGNIMADGQFIGNAGFRAQSQLSATIDGSADNIVALPTASGRLVFIYDSTTEGSATVALTPTGHRVIDNGLTSVTFTVSGGFLKGATTAGASSRVLYYNYMDT